MYTEKEIKEIEKIKEKIWEFLEREQKIYDSFKKEYNLFTEKIYSLINNCDNLLDFKKQSLIIDNLENELFYHFDYLSKGKNELRELMKKHCYLLDLSSRNKGKWD